MSLSGRVALVTGGARGIGRVIAQTLCERGMAVAVNDVNAETAEAAANEMRQAGHRALAVPADVSRGMEVAGMVERAENELGPLWLLVNNAGTFHGGGVLDVTEEDWDAEFAVDTKGVFLCSQAAYRGMKARGGGRIIVIASIAAHLARLGQIAYCSAKAAALHFSRCLAVEAAPHGITVNCLCPGMTDSAMFRHTVAFRGVEVADYVEMIPSGRLATAEDHAATIAFLASDEAAQITGQVLSVDGAQSIYHPVTRRG